MPRKNNSEETTGRLVEEQRKLECVYCGRVFQRESTLCNHLCEGRRRFEQRNTIHAKIAFDAYQSMLSRPVSEENFRKSTVYLPLVKWGRYMVEKECSTPKFYCQWLRRNKITFQWWCNDDIYQFWVKERLTVEDEWDAFERSVETIIKISEDNNISYDSFFENIDSVLIIKQVQEGCISPWLLFGSGRALAWLQTLSSAQLEKLFDIDEWDKLLKNKKSVLDNIAKTCEEMNL